MKESIERKAGWETSNLNREASPPHRGELRLLVPATQI